MIIFEHEKYLQNMRKNGIGATDKNAEFKIRYVMENLIHTSTYRKNKIMLIIKNLASDYFHGLPEDLIETQLEQVYDSVQTEMSEQEYEEKHKDKTITLYESEMKVIANLQDDKLMRLAFSALVVHKWCGQFFVNGKEQCYKNIKLSEADIYRVAQFDNVSGTKKDKLMKELFDKGLIEFSVKTNPAWRFHPDWIAMTMFCVPFNIDLKEDKTNEKIYKKITNYDDVLLYLDYYLGDKNIIECSDCGCPIIKKSNAKCICANCAAARKKASDKARYQVNLPIA